MGEDKNFLSQEAIQKLSNTISEAKNLAGLQLEILEKVIAVEEKIASTRIGYLDEYFDAYSKGLDLVAKKQSQLEEGYLILNNEAEKFVSNISSSDNGRLEEIEYETASIEERYETEEQLIDRTTRAKIASKKAVADAEVEQAERLIETHTKLARLNSEQQDNEVEKTQGGYDIYQAAREAMRKETADDLAEQELTLSKKLIALQNLRHQEAIDQENQLKGIRLKNIDEAASAEISTQELLNEVKARQMYTSAENYLDQNGNDTGINEAGVMRAKQIAAEEQNAFVQKLEEARIATIKRRELEAAAKNNGKLSELDATRIQKAADLEYNKALENQEKLQARQKKLEAIEARAKEHREQQSNFNTLLKGDNAAERFKALQKLTTNNAGQFSLGKAVSSLVAGLGDILTKLENTIDEIGKMQGKIDTRLQGSENDQYKGSYWNQLVKDMSSVGAITPYFKQSDFAKNIETLVNKGISFDLKQRAFLMTIQERIATTFDVTSNSLLRLVRIQQEDTTAGRLGMESSLNAFLNEMYETSEYLEGVAGSVRDSLLEMESLMSGAEAAEVEWQVQKWLGSLYSVGMSQEAVNAISSSLGQIAAGQLEGLTGGGAGNLLVMAANDAGLPIADILTDGIDSSATNELLKAAVGYLAELSDAADGNRVVQQQLANVFGVKASDLRAATNLSGSTKSIYKESLSFGEMMDRLYSMVDTMGDRISMGEKMSNVWDNFQYSLAGGIASSPAMYAIYKMASLLDKTTGGIDIPIPLGPFGAITLNVADLMRVAAVSGGILSGSGAMLSGLGSSFDGLSMLEKLGIDGINTTGLNITARGDEGSSLRLKSSGGGSKSTSGSGYVGNASGSDIKNSTIQQAEDDANQKVIEAQEEAGATNVDMINTTVLKIYEVLDAVASGKSSFSVKVEGYGLTKTGSASAAAGVSALANNGLSNLGTTGSGSALAGAGTAAVSTSSSGSIDFGNWIAV